MWAGAWTRTWSLSQPPYYPPQPPRPPSCCTFTMEPVPSPCPALPTVCSRAPRLLLPALPYPALLWAGAAGLLAVSGLNCAACRAGWGLPQETLIPGGSHRAGSKPFLVLAGPIHQLGCCDSQPCLGVMASPASTAFPRRASAVPTLLVQCPSQLSVCRHHMANALRISVPLCSTPGGRGGCSSRTPSLADHSGRCSKDMRGRKGPSLLIFRMPAIN